MYKIQYKLQLKKKLRESNLTCTLVLRCPLLLIPYANWQ